MENKEAIKSSKRLAERIKNKGIRYQQNNLKKPVSTIPAPSEPYVKNFYSKLSKVNVKNC